MKIKFTILCALATVKLFAAGVGTPVSIQGYTVTLPVTGTFTPAGPLTCNQGTPGPAWPVSGTFFQATQPVSGTFFQATQPVSGTVSATQSGTWTVQPGNTANTTAWLTTGTGGAFPEFGTGRSTNPANVTDGTTVTGFRDRQGRVMVMAEAPRELKVTGNVNLTTTAETTLIAAGAAGVFHDLTLLVISTDDSTLASSMLSVRDATAGTVIMTIRFSSSTSVPITIPFSTSISQTTAANNWTVQLSVAPTATKTVSIFAAAAKH